MVIFMNVANIIDVLFENIVKISRIIFKSVFRNDYIAIGRIRKQFRIKRSWRYGLGWRWKRVHFRRAKVRISKGINKHMIISGSSGSGKSTFLCRKILSELCKRDKFFAVLDPHGDYVEFAQDLDARPYDAHLYSCNIFDLDGLSEGEKARELTYMFTSIFKLGSIQATVLNKCIKYTYEMALRSGSAPTINSLNFTFNIFKKHAGRMEFGILSSLQDRVSALYGVGSGRRSIDISRIARSRSIICLHSLHTREAQQVYMEQFMKKLYAFMLSNHDANRDFYLLVDEADKLDSAPILGMLAAEGRKYGISVIACTHSLKKLDKELRDNAGTIFAFYQREPEELNYVANMISGGNEMHRFLQVKAMLRNLRVGEFLMCAAGREPVLVRSRQIVSKNRDCRFAVTELARKAINNDELATLLNQKGFKEEKISDALAYLFASKELGKYEVKEGIYKGIWYLDMPRNSAEHDICVELISRALERAGIANKIYNSSYGPDIIAYKNGDKIAVEYETGSKNIEDTKKMLLGRNGKYSKALVVVNDEKIKSYMLLRNDFVEVKSASEFFKSVGAAFS